MKKNVDLKLQYEDLFKNQSEFDVEELYIEVPNRIRSIISDNFKRNIENNALKALDLGYGFGTYTRHLVYHGYDVDAVDFIDEKILLNRLNKKEFNNIKIIKADLNNYKISSKYDFVISRNVLHYLKKNNLKRIIKDISLSMNNNGTAYLEIFTDIKRYNVNSEERMIIGSEANVSKRELIKILKESFSSEEFKLEIKIEDYQEPSRENKDFTYFYSKKICCICTSKNQS